MGFFDIKTIPREDIEAKQRFITIHRDDEAPYGKVIVDKETGVAYLSTGCGEGLTVLVDREGKPMIYDIK